MIKIIRSSPVLHDHWIKYLLYVSQGIAKDYGDSLVLKGGTPLNSVMTCHECQLI
jgi:predicted nucleotidyltransferase component of viral defense system